MNFREKFEAWHRSKFGYCESAPNRFTAFNCVYRSDAQLKRWVDLVTRIALTTLEWLARYPHASSPEKSSVIDQVPSHQWAARCGHWQELSQHGCNRDEVTRVPRFMNRLIINVMTPLPRCLYRTPDGRGLAWLKSGGEIEAYGPMRAGALRTLQSTQTYQCPCTQFLIHLLTPSQTILQSHGDSPTFSRSIGHPSQSKTQLML